MPEIENWDGKYRQVRITLTEQAARLRSSDRIVTVKVHVKGLNETWHSRQLVNTYTLHHPPSLDDLSAVYGLLRDLLDS